MLCNIYYAKDRALNLCKEKKVHKEHYKSEGFKRKNRIFCLLYFLKLKCKPTVNNLLFFMDMLYKFMIMVTHAYRPMVISDL